MLTRRIIPCLDVTNGRVVKGTNFVNLRDAGDPIELAKRYDQEGADELVFLDITATSDKRAILKELVERTAEQVFIPFTVGGGISSLALIREVLLSGADKVSINTAAIHTPDLLTQGRKQFGAQCIVLAIDARRRNPALPSPPPPIAEVAVDDRSIWEIYTHGGRKPTGIDAVKWAGFGEYLGAGEILLTSMDQDGTKAGYDLPLLQTIVNQAKIPVIASGGAGNVQHIADALQVCEAALLASLLHFREVTIAEIKTACQQAALPVRR